MKNLKIWRLAFVICTAVLSLASCSSDDESYSIYTFGLTSAINGNNVEIEAIELAYSDAYKMNGLKFNSQTFAPGTSKDLILTSCKQAENAILTSSMKFDGRYVYKVKSKDEVLYQKVYGIR
ncbi:MAG: hypothetical protein ILA29_05950 [Prevotella sp.]|nr:hypothetical protein [Prevotella sp.]